MTTVFRRVAVLGLGMIGGSLLRALRETGLAVIGHDPDPRAAAAAYGAGFDTARDPAAAVSGCDLVVLAMPLPELDAALAGLSGAALSPDAVLTDVGTLKAPVLGAVRAALPGARFVGGHPLAGVEQSGWVASDPLLFRDAPWSLTLEPDTDLAAWIALADLLCGLGARPVAATAADQDAAVARVIGLPHVLAEALALVGLDGGELGLSLAAGSYLSGSRVARTRPDLVASWCDGNPALLSAIDEALARLGEARNQLAGGGSMLGLAQAGNRARLDWEHRTFEAVELPADRAALLAHGAHGGWITAVLHDASPVTLLGMRPVPRR